MLAPAGIFLCLGYIVKRKELVGDIRRALPETGLNLQIMLFNLVFTMPILVLASTFLSSFWHSTGLIFFTPTDWNSFPVWGVCLIALVIGDFVGYWRHRFEHNSFLWPSHAVHHSDTEMTWLTLERFHPINRLTTFAIDSSALLILGLPPYAVVANSLVRHYYGFFIHADLPWTYGKWNILLVSPAMHRWHHSANEVAYGRNFATIFGLWDWAFGTHYVPGPFNGPLGVVTDDMERTLWSQFSYTFRPKAYAQLFRRKPNQDVIQNE
jgi:sterol desaturase/sphingolipid hydroxylase (fatty acid hydroxylase superfamily)